MGKYGESAIMAVKRYRDGQAKSLLDAWEQATLHFFSNTLSGQRKSCPKGAFLGLCEEGLVKGIPPGEYTISADNKRYAVDAVALLRRNPSLAQNRAALWRAVMRGKAKERNQQMDVVVSLWDRGLINQ